MHHHEHFFQVADAMYLSNHAYQVADFTSLVITTPSCTAPLLDELNTLFSTGLATADGNQALCATCNEVVNKHYDAVLFLGDLDCSIPWIRKAASDNLDRSKLVGLSSGNAELLASAETLRGRHICCSQASRDLLVQLGAQCYTDAGVQRCRNLISYVEDWRSFIANLELAARGLMFARYIGCSQWFEEKSHLVMASIRSDLREDYTSDLRVRLIAKFAAAYGKSICRGQMCSPAYWYRSMVNERRNLQRRSRIRFCYTLHDSDIELTGMSTTGWSEQQKLAVVQALGLFPSEMQKHRDILTLRYLGGWQVQQIAEHIDVSTKSILRWTKQGLVKLNELLAELIEE